MTTLDEFEAHFKKRISGAPAGSRTRAGALLPIVPGRGGWEIFLDATRAAWPTWQASPERYPSSLIVLYGGLAFYEYEDTSFWPHFANAVGAPVPQSLYKRLNEAHQAATQDLGMRVIQRPGRNSYVGSAVHHIGIPLSLWDGFLDICDWAQISEGWREASDAEWEVRITRISGSRKRLRAFLLGNRDVASDIIVEMLDARSCLIKDPNLTLDGLKNISFVRPEYFDEVPETAEFLRPDSPDSLIYDRPRLNWNERGSIGLHVPGIPHDKLPATWSINGKKYPAAATPTEIPLDSAALQPNLAIKLVQKNGEDRDGRFQLIGAKPWALFDVERSGYRVNSARESLPLRGYALISPEPLEIKREGFAEDDYPVNEPYTLKDGTACFFTRLLPKDRRASITIGTGASASTLRFRTRKRIEARLFFGREFRSAWFQRNPEQINVEGLPLICVLIPQGYFANSAQTLETNFKVLLDEKPGGGQWVHQGEALEDYDLFCWQWSDRPFREARTGVKLKDWKDLGAAFKPTDISGKHTLVVEAQRFAIKFSYPLLIQPDKDGMARFWKGLPKKFLPMFLLNQSPDGLKSEEMEFASPVVAPEIRFPYYLLKQYADCGLLVLRGRYWSIRESRARIIQEADSCTLKYCGDPSILWALYRRMVHVIGEKSLPAISVSEASDALEKELEATMKELGITSSQVHLLASEKMDGVLSPGTEESKSFTKGMRDLNRLLSKYERLQKKKEYRTPPYLIMRWPANSQRELHQFFKGRNVRIVSDLWNH